MPVHEILFFPASDVLFQHDDALLPIIHHVSQADGLLDLRHGFVEEDNRICYLLLKWETLGHHRALMNAPNYPSLLEKLKKVSTGAPQMFHVEFDNDASPAFDAPTTEITWIHLKPGKTKADLKEVLYKHIGPKLMALPGVVSGSAAWTSTIEDASKYILAVGWESSRQHTEGTQLEKFKEPLAKLSAISDYRIAHVSFTTFKST